jgi:hypothetical protein
MSNEPNTCGCKKKLAIRLADAFEPVDYGTKAEMSFDQAANWLEVSPEELETLVNVGLVSAWDRKVTLEALVVFLEETDWLRRRAEGRLLHLQTAVSDAREFARRQAAAESSPLSDAEFDPLFETPQEHDETSRIAEVTS